MPNGAALRRSLLPPKSAGSRTPVRCADVRGFWDALPAWEQLGSVIALGCYAMPDWVRATALDKLVPDSLLTQIVGRPELSDYTAKLQWVRAQMEHAHGFCQAQQQLTEPRRPKEPHMGAVAAEQYSQLFCGSCRQPFCAALRPAIGKASRRRTAHCLT